MARSKEALDLMAEEGLITAAEARDAYDRLRPTTSLEEAARGADYIAESVLELLGLKKEVFAKLDEICPPSTLLTTNTSGLLATEIAKATKHPERVVIAHYFQPPHFMPLVEIVRGDKTSQETVDRTARVLRGLHKKVVIINKETPGFAGNRIQRALATEIQKLVDEGICTPETIDDIVQFGFGRRMAYTGYFKRMDLIGLDFGYMSAKDQGRVPGSLLPSTWSGVSWA